jgi:Bacterial TSP3 repeat
VSVGDRLDPGRRLVYVPQRGTAFPDSFALAYSDSNADSGDDLFVVETTLDPGADTDGDGLPDVYETRHGLNPLLDDAASDPDGDGLSSLREFTETHTDPDRADTDRDGLNDGIELTRGTLPLNPDTDGDRIVDGRDPAPLSFDADLDGDHVRDQDDSDVDGDALSNVDEIGRGTDPRKFDTDGDGYADGFEVEAGSDPRLANSRPALFIVGDPAPGHDVVLPSPPTTDLAVGGVTVSEPVVDVVLPTAPVGDLTLGGITVSEPPVDVVLPAAPPGDLTAGGITVSEPPVDVVLPSPPSTDPTTGGITVSEPPVDVVLPAAPAGDLSAGGITVAEPPVDVVLPMAPTGDLASGGIVVSEPVVLVDWTAPSGSLASPRFVAAEAAPVEPRLLGLRVERDSAGGVPRVTLEWEGPPGGRLLIESSPDLLRWRVETAERQRLAEGRWNGRLSAGDADARFYRIRLAPPSEPSSDAPDGSRFQE